MISSMAPLTPRPLHALGRCLLRRSFTASAHHASTQPPPPVAFALDLDGVLHHGINILPGATKALAYLEGRNKYKVRIPYVFLTNSGGIKESLRAKTLSHHHRMEFRPHQVIQSHTVFSTIAAKHGTEPVLVVGGPNYKFSLIRSAMRDYGFENAYLAPDIHAKNSHVWPFTFVDTELQGNTRFVPEDIKFKAILIFHDSRDWGRDIQIMLDVLRGKDGNPETLEDAKVLKGKEQIPVYVAHRDILWQGRHPLPRIGLGAFLEAFEGVYKSVTGLDLQYTTFGKPSTTTFEYAEKMLAKQSAHIASNSETDEPDSSSLASTYPPETKVYMIGDSPESDIRGANDFGWESCLVQTGVYKAEHGAPKHSPTMIVENVEEAVRKALEKEWGAGAVEEDLDESQLRSEWNEKWLQDHPLPIKTSPISEDSDVRPSEDDDKRPAKDDD